MLMQLVLAPVMNQAGHSAYPTVDGTPVSVHALVEVLHRNLHTIRHITYSSTQQQLYEAAVLLPLQQEAQPRKEEADIINQVLHQRCSFGHGPCTTSHASHRIYCEVLPGGQANQCKVMCGSRVCAMMHIRMTS